MNEHDEPLHPTVDPRADLMQAMVDDRFDPGMYRRFYVPKASGGRRLIVAPNARLMEYQQDLLRRLLDYELPGSPHAHAYYYHRSIRTMAEPHVGRAVVVKLDLKDFFPTISPQLVRAALLRRNIATPLINLIGKWCFLPRAEANDDLPAWGLPIGAPTSPLLSNLVAADRLDARLAGLARRWFRNALVNPKWREHDIEYTRYADDLVFSSNDERLAGIIPIVRRIVADGGFRLNERKVYVQRRVGRQVVCGVVVNARPGAPRPARQSLRHELFRLACDVAQGRCAPHTRIDRLATDGLPVVSPLDWDRLRGRLNHVHWLNPSQARDLHRLFDRLVDLHRPPHQQHADTVAWRRRQEDRCTRSSASATPPNSLLSTAT